MKFNRQHKLGIIKLGALLGVIYFLIVLYKNVPPKKAAFVLNNEAQCFVENQQALLAEAETEKVFTYYVNSISDYVGYQLGLFPDQIDRLLAYRNAGNLIYTVKDFEKVTSIDPNQLDSIKSFLKFPKQKFQKPKKLKQKSTSIVLKEKLEMNTVSAKELQEKLKLPDFIARRIVNFRTSLNGYKSMDQLEKVYGILPYQLKRIRVNGYLK